MKKRILLLAGLALVVFAVGCGGKKIKDTGLGGDDEILFVNDTSENTYRITVVGTTAEFTLRAATQKSVSVPTAEEGDEPLLFNVNIERIEGDSGDARHSIIGVRAGQTVRILLKADSFRVKGLVKFEVEG